MRRIKQAIKRNELIMVWGDYDIDGIEIFSPIITKIAEITLPGAAIASICAVEVIPEITAAISIKRDDLQINPVSPFPINDKWDDFYEKL